MKPMLVLAGLLLLTTTTISATAYAPPSAPCYGRPGDMTIETHDGRICYSPDTDPCHPPSPDHCYQVGSY